MPPALFVDTENSSGIGASLLPQSSASSLRSVFLTASIVWSICTVSIAAWLGLWTLSSSISAGICSLLFSVFTAAQALVAYMKMRQTLRRFVRFGLSSAAFARVNPRWMISWIILSLGVIGTYIAALVIYVELATSGADDTLSHVGKVGLIWLSIIGVFMLSLIVGFIVVSRVSPWLSSWFIRMPPTPHLVIPEMD